MTARGLLRGLAGLALAVLSAAAALIAMAARSDFLFRGCADIPRESWEMTANCLDGWFGQLFFGALALAGSCLVGLMAYRSLVS